MRLKFFMRECSSLNWLSREREKAKAVLAEELDQYDQMQLLKA